MYKAEILIVEDDLLTATVIKKYLSKSGYNVISVAKNEEEALREVEKSKPDLILMDIFLKDSIDGIEIASIIQKKYDIPILYLTADSSEETIQRAKITEPFGYLVKPVDSRILLTNVELTIHKHHAQTKKILETLRVANDELEQKVNERTSELSLANEELINEIKQRKIAEEALRKADKLATIGKMSAVLAHEIRNPLNSIKINSDIIAEMLELPENHKRRLQIIQKEVTRLDNLVKDILQFSNQRSIVVSELDIKQLIDQINAQIKHCLKEKNISLLNKIPQVIVKCDSEKIKQVFLNLILNAVDAISSDGIIEIYSKIINDYINIFVKDNGCGIDNSEKLFEPFFSTKPMGTGLGLSISQNIIEQHYGSLKLLSSKKGETIFLITLPIKF